MVLGETFPQQPETAIASYDWINIVEGMAGIRIYLAKDWNAGGEKNMLVGSALTGSANMTANTTENYDSQPINRPHTIGGGWAAINITGGGTGSASFTFKKVHGETVTDISTTQTTPLAAGIRLLFVEITKTDFAVGDYLRVEITTASAQITLSSTTIDIPVLINNL